MRALFAILLATLVALVLSQGDSYNSMYECVDGVWSAGNVTIKNDQMWYNSVYSLGHVVLDYTGTVNISNCEVEMKAFQMGETALTLDGSTTFNVEGNFYAANGTITIFSGDRFGGISVGGDLFIESTIIFHFDYYSSEPVPIFSGFTSRSGEYEVLVAIDGVFTECSDLVFTDNSMSVIITCPSDEPSSAAATPSDEPIQPAPSASVIPAPNPAPPGDCKGESYDIFTCEAGTWLAINATITGDQIWFDGFYDLVGTTTISGTVNIVKSEVTFAGPVSVSGVVQVHPDSGVTFQKELSMTGGLLIKRAEAFPGIGVEGDLTLGGELGLEFTEVPSGPVTIFSGFTSRSGDFSKVMASIGGEDTECIEESITDSEYSIVLGCPVPPPKNPTPVNPSEPGSTSASTSEQAPTPNPTPTPKPTPSPKPTPTSSPTPASPVPTPTPTVNWAEKPNKELLPHVNDTLVKLTLDTINTFVGGHGVITAFRYELKSGSAQVHFLLQDKPKNDVELLKGLRTLLVSKCDVASKRVIGDGIVSPDLSPSSETVPGDAPEPGDVPAPAKRSVFADDSDWWTGYYAYVTIDDVSKKATDSMTFFIIVGVITAVALIITVVLIISLNKRKEDEYMPVDDDLENPLLKDNF